MRVAVDRLLLMMKVHIPSNANASKKYGAPMAAWAYGSERTGMAMVQYMKRRSMYMVDPMEEGGETM